MANGMFALVTVHPKSKATARRALEPAFLGLPMPSATTVQTKAAGSAAN